MKLNKIKVAEELVKLAKELTAKPEIDFKEIAESLDKMVEKIDDHMNGVNFYDNVTTSQIDKATRQLISAKKILEKIEAFDEDTAN